MSGGDNDAFDRLVPLVHDQLRKLAARSLQSQRPEHTLRATALVHEAYLKLAGFAGEWKHRVHFYAVAARAMRNILVDYAKAARHEGGAGDAHVTLDEALVVAPSCVPMVADLDESLRRLEAHDTRKGRIVELLYFGGLTYDEASEVVGVSTATIHRELRMAKAWLHRDLSGQTA